MSICIINNAEKNTNNKLLLPTNLTNKIRSNSVKNTSNISLSQDFYKKSTILYNPNLQILNYIMSCAERKLSARTGLSNNTLSDNINYNLIMLNKHEEHLNDSLSYISDFDLENNGENNIENSFSSENDDNDDENSFEKIEIYDKRRSLDILGINANVKVDDINIKLNKDFDEIKKILLGK